MRLLSAVLLTAMGCLWPREPAPRPAGPEQAPGELAELRAALALHFAERGGAYPARLEEAAPDGLPELRLPSHPPSSAATLYPAEARRAPSYAALEPAPEDAGIDPAALRDTGGWGYIPAQGHVFIDCVHEGPGGRPWFER